MGRQGNSVFARRIGTTRKVGASAGLGALYQEISTPKRASGISKEHWLCAAGTEIIFPIWLLPGPWISILAWQSRFSRRAIESFNHVRNGRKAATLIFLIVSAQVTSEKFAR